ncbi:MAG TPA: DUF1385 domain-containing protein [Candidatus Nanoarchaeia archaeon]|nr:DUF1385 domain-containing protein [Candidatus Nanoarchaeia archaeon]
MKKFNVGGQAVIEGVMLRSPHYYAVSVRIPHGKIKTKTAKLKSQSKFFKLPFVRGMVSLVDMLVLGIQTLIWSANQQATKKEEKINASEIFWTLLISIGFALLFFVALPYIFTNLLGFAEESRPVLFNLIDAAIKIALFLAYLAFISTMKDVKILFQYHGAEHKSVYCHESGKKLTVANVNSFSTKHPRCGTSFIFIVFVFSVLIFSLLPLAVIALFPDFNSLSFGIRKGILFPLRLLMIPIIAGFSYEILKLSAKHQRNIFIKLIVVPGLWLQHITTKQPTKKQIEVALASMKAVLGKEAKVI